ncbi:MAG: glycosyltransferase, partial [Gemmatimonadetes bacterium]|nr:glycosyltransferase [Gemmatimonadota bacterium]
MTRASRRVLIVSPHFPPVNAPDMQRARLSLPHFAEFGWEPTVLAVDPAYVVGVKEPRLLRTIPSDVSVRRVRALPARWTRRVGVGNLGLRALPFLYRTGVELIEELGIDLVYFSTSQFAVVALGPLWKRRLGVPFVVDLQDPWLSEYYESKPRSERPPKYWLAQRLNRFLEPWTMREVDGIVAVSEAYPETLRRRYPWIAPERCRTIPVGASPLDFEVAREAANGSGPRLSDADGVVQGLYAGVLGNVMKESCLALCLALEEGLRRSPDLFSRVRLHFVGTSYVTGDGARTTIAPLAAERGLQEHVHEEPRRLPYFDTLNLLMQADFLLVLGSDNPQYTASKIYPYILARKPLLVLFHEESSVVEVVRST